MPPLLRPAPDLPAWTLAPSLARCLAEYATLERSPYPARPDGREDTDAFERRVTRMEDLLMMAARAPCDSAFDIAAKISIVCRRLRHDLDPDDVDQRITYLLAESVRDAVLGVMTEGAPLHPAKVGNG